MRQLVYLQRLINLPMLPSNLLKISRSHWLVVGGLLCLVSYGYLSWVSRGYGQATLTNFYVGVLPGVVITFGLLALELRGHIRLSWSHVLLFAVLFRVLGVLAYPVLEDDHFRYLWDGWMFVEFGSPYGVAPAEFFAAEFPAKDAPLPDGFVDILDGINYPEVATVYGPVAQWLFGLSYLIAPAKIWPLQLICATADLLIIVLLARMAPLRWVFVYAWSPLLIKEFAFTAHIDVVGAAALVFAIWAGRQSRLSTLKASVLIGVCLGLAVGIKLFAVIAVPFLLKRNVVGWIGFATTCLLVSIPFGVAQAWAPEGLQVMADAWYFNSPLYYLWLALWPTDLVVTSLPWFKVFLTGGFVCVWVGAILWRQRGNNAQRNLFGYTSYDTHNTGPLYWLFGLLFLVLPVLNPWYLVWLLVFAVLRPTVTAWVASVTLLLSYITGLNLGDDSLSLYGQPTWALLLEFVP
ncbi:MAG: hypothetical protein GXP16_12410, partial [Gammaproteobacteria bacterium]|nr:hypothetical protein [Gammaproteobacteria bacterium]